MEALELLGPERCYVEFGAGKGKLSHWIHVALQEAENVHFLLVERSSTRFKVCIFKHYSKTQSVSPHLLL